MDRERCSFTVLFAMPIAVAEGDKAVHCSLVALDAGLYIENVLRHRHVCIVGDHESIVEATRTNVIVRTVSFGKS